MNSACMLSLFTGDRGCVGGNVRKEVYSVRGGKGRKRKPGMFGFMNIYEHESIMLKKARGVVKKFGETD